MDTERSGLYTQFIMSPEMAGPKLFDELQNTPFLQDYNENQWVELAKTLSPTNKIIQLVNENIILPASDMFLNEYPDIATAIFGAVQAALIPQLAKPLAEKFGIENGLHLMLAASHIGVTKTSDLYQKAEGSEKAKLEVYAMYFATAQAKLLGFKTSTTFLALDLGGKSSLRLKNIAVVSKFETEGDIRKALTKAIFEGKTVTDLGDGKFLV